MIDNEYTPAHIHTCMNFVKEKNYGKWEQEIDLSARKETSLNYKVRFFFKLPKPNVFVNQVFHQIHQRM